MQKYTFKKHGINDWHTQTQSTSAEKIRYDHIMYPALFFSVEKKYWTDLEISWQGFLYVCLFKLCF